MQEQHSQNNLQNEMLQEMQVLKNQNNQQGQRNLQGQKKVEQYSRISSLFDGVDGVNVRQRRGGSFHFPIYMTESLSRTDIEVLDLSTRSYNCLRRAGINTIGQLCEHEQCSSYLKNIRCCGSRSIAEIMDNLMYYQYMILQPERRGAYLAKVVEMNVKMNE